MRIEDLITRLSSYDPKLKVLITKNDDFGTLATDVTLELQDRAGEGEVLVIWLEE